MPRLCVITDIHHGCELGTKQGHHAARLMETFTAFCAQAAPDLVIDMGDRITDVDHDTDLRLEAEAKAMFAPITAPVQHLCGNHDRDFLSVAENEAVLGQSLESQVVPLDGWDIVLWRADTVFTHDDRYLLPDSDLEWLRGVMDRATQPMAVFSHLPLSGQQMRGNFYFEHNEQSARYDRTAEIREALALATVPVACFSGHAHWNGLTMLDARPHFTLQSLTESYTTRPGPAGCFAQLELGDMLDWTVHGQDRFEASLPVAQMARQWTSPLPRFVEIRDKQSAR